MNRGFPGGTSDKEPSCHHRRHQRLRLDPWVGKIPWRRPWQPTPVFLPWESQRVGHDWSNVAQHSTVSRSRRVFEVCFGKSLDYLEETLLVELMQVKRWLWWDLRHEEHAIGNRGKGDPIYKVAEKVKLFPSILWKVEIKSNKLWYLAAEISKQCLWCSQISSYSLEYTGGEREIKGVVKQKWTRSWRFGEFLAYLQYSNLQEKYIGDHFVICLNVKSLCCTPETNMTMYINYSLKKRNTHLVSDN